MSQPCVVSDCTRPQYARGWCGAHYQRWWASGDVQEGVPFRSGSPEVRFWNRVRRGADDECWEWDGWRNDVGYGYLRVGDTDVPVHRFAYALLVGHLSDEMQIDHLCRNRGCVNPRHLEAVTQRENILRGLSPAARHARKTHCIHGHPFDEVNTYLRRDGKGHRQCRTCQRERQRLERVR